MLAGVKRRVSIVLVVVGAVASVAFIAYRMYQSECSAPLTDTAATYQRFLSLWSKRVSEKEGRLRVMSEAEKREAWACLNASADAGAPEATYVLQLFYESGRAEFGLAPDYELAEHYKRLTAQLRSVR